MENEKTHILVVPYPAQGHMIPLLDLTHHLAATGHLTITVVTTPKNLPILSPLLSSNPTTVTPLILPFPAIPGVPAAAENSKDLPTAGFLQLIPGLSLLEEPLSRWFESHPSPPVAIISDLFVGWTQRLALKFGIKRVVFTPSGALGLSVIYALWKDMPPRSSDDVMAFQDIPNCPTFPWRQLSSIYRSYVKGDANSELIKEGFRDDMESWGLVVNSFDDLERVYLDHLVKLGVGHDHVWAVGPLLPPNGLKDRGGPTSDEMDLILSWLDTCKDDEVVYVSFGTQASLTPRQMEAVAEALDQSGVRFIWSLRSPVMEGGSEHGDVPLGFVDRVAGRGMVVRGWVAQVVILKHRAVGTILTHCGWNSVLEGIIAGVGMLVWPMGADNFSNAILLVDQLKVAVRICDGPEFVPDPTELARILVDSVRGDLLDRRRIAELQSSALEALSENGSSSKELVSLVNKLRELKTMPIN